MTAKDAIAPQIPARTGHNQLPDAAATVTASTPLTQALERMAAGSELLSLTDEVTGETLGVITPESMLKAVSGLFPQLNESSELTITCPPSHYSASAIAHAVEDADAHLLNLNVIAGTEPDSLATVVLRVNHSRGESVARSLARYGYKTLEIAGQPGVPVTEIADRVKALLHYLEI